MASLSLLNEPEFRYGGILRKKEPPLKKEHIYSFTSIHKTKYIVHVEEYSNDLFLLKFHLKKHQRNKDKYLVLTQENNCPKGILSGVLSIALDILRKNEMASFGFIGSPTVNELYNEDYLKNTKRFKVYAKLAITFFDPDHFIHHQDVNHSSYLLINKKKSAELTNLLNEILIEFDTYFDLSMLFAELRNDLLKSKK